MKKYWLLGIGFFSIISISTLYIRSTTINDSQVLGEFTSVQKPFINPTEYIQKLTEAPIRKLTETAQRKSLLNPTEYIKRLTGPPNRNITPNLTGAAEHKQRLTDQKLKLCLEKSTIIVKRSTQLGEMVTNMEKKFTSIVDGVKGYYVKRELTLVNYNELVAAIETKKNTLLPLVEVAKADVADFSCTGENPSEQLKKYKTDMQAVVTALQDYRKSIQNLIVAIKGLIVPEVTVTGEPTVIQTISL